MAADERAFCFEGHTLDLRRGCLCLGEREVELRPKSFAVLRYLVENAGRLVPKDELIKAVWPDVVVADESLTRCVSDVRLALSDIEHAMIKTVPRRGYLFAAAVSLRPNDERTVRTGERSEANAVDDQPSEVDVAAESIPLAPRLSIVVLPFANLDGDAEQDHFVDGLTEDLTIELSRLPGSFVIARNSAFSFKGRSLDARQVGRELGVRYVVEGSVRKAMQRVRVGAQLIEVETGALLWADRFDRTLSDLFELLDAITHALARVLDIHLVEAESRRSERVANPDALDLVMRARAFTNRGISLGNRAAATRLYKQALELAPDNVHALMGLSVVMAGNVAEHWSETPEEDLCHAEALAARALALAPHDARCHLAMGFVRRLQHRFDDAINDMEAAIQLDPNLSGAHAQLAWLRVFSGRGEDALPQFTKTIQLSPRDPQMFLGYFGIGFVRFLVGHDDGAIEMMRKAIALNSNYSPAYLCLAAAHGMQGRIEAARVTLATYLRTGTPTNTIALLRARPMSIHPAYLVQRERLYEGLRRAGMTEK